GCRGSRADCGPRRCWHPRGRRRLRGGGLPRHHVLGANPHGLLRDALHGEARGTLAMFDAASAGYVLLLGMVAAFNPCGFALLPAYLTVIMTRSASAQESASASLWRAVSFAGALTVGFLVVFGFFGVLFGAVNL